MYRWLRNTHLFFGLFCCAALLMYGVSAVQMAHNSWFNNRPAVTESAVPVPPEAGGDARSVARELMDRHGMTGEIQQVRVTDAGFQFRITRPGTVYEVDYRRPAGEAKIRANVANLIGMLNRIHHVGGVWHEYSLVNLWGFYLGLVAFALIGLGLTGIYLWFKIHRERKIGAVLLSLSLGYSLTLMALIRLA